MQRLLKFTAVTMAAFALTTTATIAAVPVLRHATVAWFHDPAALPALAADPRVHYEPGAEDFATEVARLLPEAIARVEAAQGRPFARPPVVAVYRDAESYAIANGSGSGMPAGVTFNARVTLAPFMWTRRRDQLQEILTHELSHAHLQTQVGAFAFSRIPSWFLEGLAVMVSDGGGAANVSEATARAAIAEGYVIAVRDTTSLFGYPFDPPQDRNLFPLNPIGQHMIYRQAGMFVAYLRESQPEAFKGFLQSIEDGEPFKRSFESAYGQDLSQAWRSFREHQR